MVTKRDYYEVLGISRSATDKETANAYRKLAIKYHPDKNPGDDEVVAKFKEAAEAFEVLGDKEKRARYDRYGHAGIDGPGGGSPHFSDINDIFETFGEMFGEDMFGGLFGGQARRRRTRGADVQCQVTLELSEAAKGIKKELEFERHEKCEDCGGSGAKTGTKPQKCDYCGGRGQVIQSAGILRVQTTCPSCQGSGSVVKDPCRACSGAGYVLHEVKRQISIPAGIDDQMRVRLSGEGEPDPNGGPRGDCYCFVHVKPHPLFERQGLDLVCQIPITYSQAVLGSSIEIPNLKGKQMHELPRGTQSGDVIRLRGLGMPDPRSPSRVGDLLVQVHIEVPKVLTSRQEELLREFAELEHANVTPHRKNFFEKLKDYFVSDDSTLNAEA